jgi:N-acetylneuraminate synthase
VEDIDNVVNFFSNRNIPLAINHCVSIYPSEKEELQLNQIDFLKMRYPNLVIGFSTHEYNERADESIMIAYAKGARTFERHIDIDDDDVQVSPYCALPVDIDAWFKGYARAVAMCGNCCKENARIIPEVETEYLDALVRGAYAAVDLPIGHTIETNKDAYFAIPLHKGQLSCRESLNGKKILKEIKKDEPIQVSAVEMGFSDDTITMINQRGL